MLKQCWLLSALGFAGLIAVSAVAQNPRDPANILSVANITENHQESPCERTPACGREPYAVASPEWYDNGHFDPAKRTKKLSKQLKLTADQQSQMLDTLESTKSQLEAVRSDRSLSRKVRNCKLALIREAANNQMYAFLEKEQKTQLAHIRSHAYNFDRSPAIFP